MTANKLYNHEKKMIQIISYKFFVNYRIRFLPVFFTTLKFLLNFFSFFPPI